MSIHLQRAIEQLEKHLLSLSEIVEEHFSDAIQALVEHNPILAKQVVERDQQIDLMEVELEELCLQVLGTASAGRCGFARGGGRDQDQHRPGTHWRPGREHCTARQVFEPQTSTRVSI